MIISSTRLAIFTIQLNSLLLVNGTLRRTMVPTGLELWAHWYVFHLKEMPRKAGLFNPRNVVLSWNKTETGHKARPNSRESFHLALCCTLNFWHPWTLQFRTIVNLFWHVRSINKPTTSVTPFKLDKGVTMTSKRRYIFALIYIVKQIIYYWKKS